jgi:DNA-binding transcriptional LysR family regulator
MNGLHMEMSHLRTFRAVADALNFTRAAERMNLTQSAVSQHIKSLETELGEPLFVRTKRGVKLSEAGKLASEYVDRILDDARQLEERFSGRESRPAGRVRVAAATQALVHLFAPLFEEFIAAHAGIDLTFRTTASTDQTVSDILNGSIDVGFASLPVYSPTMQVLELFEDELLLVVGRNHRFGRAREVTVEEIQGERLILFERGASIRRATDQFFNRVKVTPTLALESNDAAFIKIMVEHGVGISLLPAWSIRDEVLGRKLVQMKIKDHQLRRSVAVVSLRQFLSSAARAFVSFILSQKPKLQEMAAGVTSLK